MADPPTKLPQFWPVTAIACAPSQARTKAPPTPPIADFLQARGEIFVWLNADDTFLPGAIRTAAEYLTAHPEIDVVYGEGWWIDDNGADHQPLPHPALGPQGARTRLLHLPARRLHPRLRLPPLRLSTPISTAPSITTSGSAWPSRAFASPPSPDYLANSRMHTGAKTIYEREAVFEASMTCSSATTATSRSPGSSAIPPGAATAATSSSNPSAPPPATTSPRCPWACASIPPSAPASSPNGLPHRCASSRLVWPYLSVNPPSHIPLRLVPQPRFPPRSNWPYMPAPNFMLQDLRRRVPPSRCFRLSWSCPRVCAGMAARPLRFPPPHRSPSVSPSRSALSIAICPILTYLLGASLRCQSRVGLPCGRRPCRCLPDPPRPHLDSPTRFNSEDRRDSGRLARRLPVLPRRPADRRAPLLPHQCHLDYSVRTAFVHSISTTGIPPQNPFFQPGHPSPSAITTSG